MADQDRADPARPPMHASNCRQWAWANNGPCTCGAAEADALARPVTASVYVVGGDDAARRPGVRPHEEPSAANVKGPEGDGQDVPEVQTERQLPPRGHRPDDGAERQGVPLLQDDMVAEADALARLRQENEHFHVILEPLKASEQAWKRKCDEAVIVINGLESALARVTAERDQILRERAVLDLQLSELIHALRKALATVRPPEAGR